MCHVYLFCLLGSESALFVRLLYLQMLIALDSVHEANSEAICRIKLAGGVGDGVRSTRCTYAITHTAAHSGPNRGTPTSNDCT
jgi:hypothetical protein